MSTEPVIQESHSTLTFQIGDSVLVNVTWTEHGWCRTSRYRKTQRMYIRQVNNETVEGEVAVPGKYEWRHHIVKKTGVLDRVPHGRDADCCVDCAVGFDSNCGFESQRSRQLARERIEILDKRMTTNVS
mgnify:CR=1 FL=1